MQRLRVLGGCLALVAIGCGSKAGSTSGGKGGATSSTGGMTGKGGSGSAGSSGSSSAGGSSGSSGGGAVDSGPPPPTTTKRSPPGSCEIDDPAFCEQFETPQPGGRGGDIDESIWAFSRWGHETRQHFVRDPASTETDRTISSTFCGKAFSNILLDNDVVACDGIGVDGLTSHQLNEVYDDQGDFAFNGMRIRQPFDFTGRTGTIMFDVDAKVNPYNLGHGWWVEMWVTEDPSPLPYHEAPGVVSYPRNGIGINFQGLNTCPQGREATEISRVFVTNNYSILHDIPGWELTHDPDPARCFKIADTKLNRIKVLINKSQLEVWASDDDDPTNLHHIATAPTIDLPFERGYVTLQHSQYNARKDGNVTGEQTYRWDNVGFDGPAYLTPRAYEVPDNTLPDIDGTGGHMYGYQLTDTKFTTLPLKGVDLTNAMSATFDFSFLADSGRSLVYRFNGGPQHTFTVPDFDREGLRGFSTDVPLSELVSGDNTLDVMMSSGQTDPEEYVGNLELTVQQSQ